MTQTQLRWLPATTLSSEEIEEVILALTDGRGNVSVLGNGTLLFVKKSADDEAFARDLVEDFSGLYNFTVVPVDIGGYLVEFHEAVAVYVGAGEFAERKEEILNRLGDLVFPGEKISMPLEAPEEHALVGAYARGKLRRDAKFFRFLKRL